MSQPLLDGDVVLVRNRNMRPGVVLAREGRWYTIGLTFRGRVIDEAACLRGEVLFVERGQPAHAEASR